MRLTAPKRSVRTTVAAATMVLVAASMAGRADTVAPFDSTVSLDSGGAGASITDRALQVPAISVSQARLKDNKGTRQLKQSALDHLDIPATALAAYQRAAGVMEQVDESCGLSWTLIAAIGRVESDHGRYAGARLRTDGTSSPEIRGVALDGQGPVAEIRDTDAGELDGDKVWDRAVGPMQFLPSTWSVVGVDADEDGVALTPRHRRRRARHRGVPLLRAGRPGHPQGAPHGHPAVQPLDRVRRERARRRAFLPCRRLRHPRHPGSVRLGRDRPDHADRRAHRRHAERVQPPREAPRAPDEGGGDRPRPRRRGPHGPPVGQPELEPDSVGRPQAERLAGPDSDARPGPVRLAGPDARSHAGPVRLAGPDTRPDPGPDTRPDPGSDAHP